MSVAENYWLIIPAAGVGTRMGADRPKQYLEVNGKKVIEHTLERLVATQVFHGIVVVISPDDDFWPELSIAKNPKISTADGGKERADSVLSGLNALSPMVNCDDWVLVHDAARCCITGSDIRKLIEALKKDVLGGVLALPVHDTLKGVDADRIEKTIDRTRIWRALTPQMFRYGTLKDALIKARESGQVVTDEASAIESAGGRPKIVEGRTDNIKITRSEDLALAKFYLEQQWYE